MTNRARCRQFHASLLSQVHNHLLTTGNILIGTLPVKDIIMVIDLTCYTDRCIWVTWAKSLSKDLSANAAIMSGFPAKTAKKSRECAQSANRLTGINRASGNQRRYNPIPKLVVGDQRESNPQTADTGQITVLLLSPHEQVVTTSSRVRGERKHTSPPTLVFSGWRKNQTITRWAGTRCDPVCGWSGLSRSLSST